MVVAVHESEIQQFPTNESYLLHVFVGFTISRSYRISYVWQTPSKDVELA